MNPLSSPLLTDLYQLTMLQAYYEQDMTGTAVFELFVRKLPPERDFLVAAGLEQALDYLEGLRFTEEELEWVRASGIFRPAFAERLRELRFTGEVHAMAEGTVCYGNEPLLRVTAPMPEPNTNRGDRRAPGPEMRPSQARSQPLASTPRTQRPSIAGPRARSCGPGGEPAILPLPGLREGQHVVRGQPQVLHDGISRTLYGGLGAGLRATARTLRHADRRGVGPLLEDSPRGRFVVSAVNGLIGDKLAERHPEAAIELAVRKDGRDVPPRRAALAEAFPAATGDLVVFLHGLSESEHYWDRRRDRTGGSYGERLAAETSWTPVYLRANTGLPIAENGAALAGLLDRLVEQWPVPVRRIALVGHSMGGLIMRAACAVQLQSRTPWHDLVTDVVTLGTPHLGAPIERGIHLGTSLLGRLLGWSANGDGQERVIESVREVAGVSEHGDLATNELWGPDAAGVVRRRAEVQVQCLDDLVAAGWRPAGGEWA